MRILTQTVVIGCAALLAVGWSRADQVEVSQLTLVGIGEVDGVTYASLYDARSGEHFLTSSKGACDGLELVGVANEESATIRQNGQTFLLRLNWPAGAVPVDAEATAQAAQNIPLPGRVKAAAPTPPEGARLPLVFQAGDLAKLNLNDEQEATIGRMRQQFTAAVGGAAAVNQAAPAVSGQDAAAQTAPETDAAAPAAGDPDAAFRNWQKAQEQSDAQFVMLFGQEAFNLSQMGVGAKASP